MDGTVGEFQCEKCGQTFWDERVAEVHESGCTVIPRTSNTARGSDAISTSSPGRCTPPPPRPALDDACWNASAREIAIHECQQLDISASETVASKMTLCNKIHGGCPYGTQCMFSHHPQMVYWDQHRAGETKDFWMQVPSLSVSMRRVVQSVYSVCCVTPALYAA